MAKYKIEDAVQYRTENPAIKNAIKLVADADGTMLATGMPLAGGELAKLVALANVGAAFVDKRNSNSANHAERVEALQAALVHAYEVSK